MNAEVTNQRALSLLGNARVQQDHANALAMATGEHFNIFQILHVGHLEVGTHSPILAEMLAPDGKHGQGPTFLKLFLSRFGITGFDADTATVHQEYHVGRVTETSGGRIDILIRDSRGGTILIENKIRAGDQENQLLRYRNFSKKAQLFFLTLDGREPGGEPPVDDLRCISYSVDILAWLEDCRKEAACVPTVRETITQYIHLLKHLTRQNTSTRMSENLTKAILQDAENYRAFIALRNTERDVRSAIISGLNEKLRAMGAGLGLVLCHEMGETAEKYQGFFFTNKALEKSRLSVGFECGKSCYQDFFLGFAKEDQTDATPFHGLLAQAFRESFNEVLSTEVWPALTFRKHHRNWDDDTWVAIQFGGFVEEVKNDLKLLLDVFEKAQGMAMQQSVTPSIP